MGIRTWLFGSDPVALADTALAAPPAALTNAQIAERSTHTRAIEGIGAALAAAGPMGVALADVQQTVRPTLNVTAYRCVQAIASNAAALDLVVLDKDNSPIADHPISVLFNRQPNSAMSARVMKDILFSRLEWKGATFAYLDRGESGVGPVTAVWPIFGNVKPVIDRTADGSDRLVGFKVRLPGGETFGLLASEVLWLRYPDPHEPWGSVAPWRAALDAAELDAKAREWQAGELDNGGRAAAVVYIGDIDEDQHRKATREWNAQMRGPRSANRYMLTSGPIPAKVERLGATADELAYLESRTRNSEDVMLAFGVPRDYLLGGATYENRNASKRTLWSDTIVPKLEIVASETDRQMVPDLAQTCAFDVSRVDALSENLDSIVGRVTRLTVQDVLLIDEARAEIGYDPLPNGAGQQTLTAYRRQINDAGAATPVPAEVNRRRTPLMYVTRTGLRTVDTRTAAPIETRKRALGDRGNVTSIYERHERIGEKALQRLADKQQRVIVREFKKKAGRTAAGLIVLDVRAGLPSGVFDSAYWQGQTEDLLEAWMGGVWDDGGERTASALGIDFTQYDKEVTRQMNRRLKVLAKQVTATTKQVLTDRLLQPGVEAGESIDALTERLTSVFDDLSTWRAETIARTETVGGFNAASRVSAEKSGIVEARVWNTASDDRVRDSHAAQNGYRTKGMDDKYPNGLMYPGDPSGDAGESIDCRCVETFVIDYGKVNA